MESFPDDDVLDAKALLQRAGVGVGMTVADFGVGREGSFLLAAGHMVTARGTVYALDVVQDILRFVEEMANSAGVQNVTTVWTDLEMYGAAERVKDESVDVGILANTLFQSTQKEAMVKECMRMMKTGGTLLMVDWKPVNTAFGPPAEQRVGPDEMKQIVHTVGGTIIESFEAGEYHWGLLVQK